MSDPTTPNTVGRGEFRPVGPAIIEAGEIVDLQAFARANATTPTLQVLVRTTEAIRSVYMHFNGGAAAVSKRTLELIGARFDGGFPGLRASVLGKKVHLRRQAQVEIVDGEARTAGEDVQIRVSDPNAETGLAGLLAS